MQKRDETAHHFSYVSTLSYPHRLNCNTPFMPFIMFTHTSKKPFYAVGYVSSHLTLGLLAILPLEVMANNDHLVVV